MRFQNLFDKKEIVKKSQDFAGWYTEVVLKAELADYAPVKGCMVIRPYGYALWENIQKALDDLIKAAGVKNAYFPLFVPESFLKKEKEHVEGFSPQLAVVTIGGGEELKEKLVVRPTSETIMYYMYAKWIKSWRDLPLLINQWCNVIRWEKRTYLFLRTTEFLWQEGHTCHASHKEAIEEAHRALSMYAEVYQKWLALPGYLGKKSASEKFPGAVETLTYEMLMSDGKALQGCTSHDLGQNFAKPFGIQFQDKDSQRHYVWQTSWGLSTRSVGALIMVHGDDNGLVLPPLLAPIQVVIIPIFGKMDSKVLKLCQELKDKIKDRVEIWDDKEQTFGWKKNEAELKGIPLTISVGVKELAERKVVLCRRDNNRKEEVSFTDLAQKVEEVLGKIQNDLYRKAQKYLKENTREAVDFSEFKKIMQTKRGFIKAFWCENLDCEAKIKEETKASTRLLLLEAKEEKGKCVYCGKPAKYRWLFAQAY